MLQQLLTHIIFFKRSRSIRDASGIKSPVMHRPSTALSKQLQKDCSNSTDIGIIKVLGVREI